MPVMHDIPQGLSVATAASYEPLTLVECKTHCRVDHTADDDKIAGLQTAARQQVEAWINRCLMKTTFRLTLDAFPDDCRGGVIRVPRPPLLSVSSITYIDTAGDSQTVTASDYRVDTNKEPGEIEPAYGKYWPATRELTGAVTVNYIAGYSSSAVEATQQAAVPAGIKAAIGLVLRDLYDQRGELVIGTIVAKAGLLDAVLAPHQFGTYY